ncbi:muscarinic acetylcholine receptor DM1 isoform X1 [Vespa velutina]|uniref:muscarinic acetylcholine receptor DM1 isoform X1 n=1 Tax=Vespa velutina TaxID=202808 RepID=UPI001FB51F67|nr:muscarinic acetylcholine receptor DM1 isoform X1 [Vespa velutina]XP_047355836.1 muscarinic acetylcholine receptor DM1 isoform X1 [Vespa velutina]XP_047355837.1 muscarinic acetylcholine receptor DM1 isoform X1 [Vespa velutina]XP_047355838.1 muscarinic acetylcholine receptor DM1 isoform X1 [Vespa velutina]XP_047355839.1 muscarinic acetylcholine receptor DM1 isoform X1 [Vespa velutina]XP_047355840.1 muscarinic acetylcholine receptor DM1 isoform X1 [Vespa velutina]XP_047355841.1 muscarinic ace
MNITLVTEIPSNDTYNVSNGLDCGGEPYQYGILERVGIVIVAIILSLVTVIGNIMVMISFKIDKQLQTISNYFLFSLAVADFAIGLISMPLFTVYTVLGYWPLGPYVCDTWLALDYLASNASVLNLLIISFDRYFSVTRPLTYRARRTTVKAAIMIGCAWGISLLLWPPWIYAWPYIEGQRTVPINACYIQFIETNHYITVGTAIAAFYVPVTVMIILYWRIWKETEKRQRDLPNLQAGKQDASKRSNSRFDEALDMDDCKRPRSESSIGADDVHAQHLAASYIEKHYPEYAGKHRPFSWTWLKLWCIAWWHSGREDEEDDEEVCGPESSRTVHGYEDTLTPLSAETPLTSTVSRCDSLSAMHSTALTIEKTIGTGEHVESKKPARSGELSTKSISSDSVYTIVINLPTRESNGGSKYSEVRPSIKMYHEEAVTFQLHGTIEDEETLASPSSMIRRPSQMPDIRIPLNAKNIPKTLPSSKGILNKDKPNQKKKKKIQEKKADSKAAKTLSAILLAFIITWTPYNILVLLKSITACTWYIPQQLWDFVYYLCYINSTVNPMCYALCNAAFRRTYMRILECKWHSRNRTAVDRG